MSESLRERVVVGGGGAGGGGGGGVRFSVWPVFCLKYGGSGDRHRRLREWLDVLRNGFMYNWKLHHATKLLHPLETASCNETVSSATPRIAQRNCSLFLFHPLRSLRACSGCCR